jgi:DNA replication ATP-dependent helicase Dna2
MERGIVDPQPVLDAILAFLAREQAALEQNYARIAGNLPDERVTLGHSLGPLKYIGRDDEGHFVCAAEADDSRFGEGEQAYLGVAALGEEAIARGIPVQYVRFDLTERRLLLLPDSFARGPTREPDPSTVLYLDPRKVDFTERYIAAAQSALGGTVLSPLVSALLLGLSSTTDGARATLLQRIARGLDLDPSQRRAFALLATGPVALVQGPPGTGKTHILGTMVSALLNERKRVLVCALAHRAVNNALNACGELAPAGIPVLKLGDPAQSEGLLGAVVPLRRASDVAARLGHGPGVVGTSVVRALSLARDGITFDVVVFDEAGQLTLPQVLCGAVCGAQRAFFFGDHRQLPPILQAEHPEDDWGLQRSAFEFLVSHHPSVMLATSYRLNRELAAFPSAAYYGGVLRASAVSAERRLQVQAIDDPFWCLLDPDAPLVWAEADGNFERAPSEIEAEVAAACVRLALRAGLHPEHIAVISPYRAQNQAIRTRLRGGDKDGDNGAEAVVVDTVERMQGQQRELVVVSLSASDPVWLENQAQFFYMPNRLNVAVTRARSKCIVLGSRTLYTYRSPNAAILRGATALRRLFGEARRFRVARNGVGELHAYSLSD